MTASVIFPAGTITQTVRGVGSAVDQVREVRHR